MIKRQEQGNDFKLYYLTLEIAVDDNLTLLNRP